MEVKSWKWFGCDPIKVDVGVTVVMAMISVARRFSSGSSL